MKLYNFLSSRVALLILSGILATLGVIQLVLASFVVSTTRGQHTGGIYCGVVSIVSASLGIFRCSSEKRAALIIEYPSYLYGLSLRSCIYHSPDTSIPGNCNLSYLPDDVRKKYSGYLCYGTPAYVATQSVYDVQCFEEMEQRAEDSTGYCACRARHPTTGHCNYYKDGTDCAWLPTLIPRYILSSYVLIILCLVVSFISSCIAGWAVFFHKADGLLPSLFNAVNHRVYAFLDYFDFASLCAYAKATTSILTAVGLCHLLVGYSSNIMTEGEFRAGWYCGLISFLVGLSGLLHCYHPYKYFLYIRLTYPLAVLVCGYAIYDAIYGVRFFWMLQNCAYHCTPEDTGCKYDDWLKVPYKVYHESVSEGSDKYDVTSRNCLGFTSKPGDTVCRSWWHNHGICSNQYSTVGSPDSYYYVLPYFVLGSFIATIVNLLLNVGLFLIASGAIFFYEGRRHDPREYMLVPLAVLEDE